MAVDEQEVSSNHGVQGLLLSDTACVNIIGLQGLILNSQWEGRGGVIAEREARQVIESQCRFCIIINTYIFNAGRGYVKRAGLNQYEWRAGHPCNLRG